jgi:8-oxo-dGTP pyrophosphatase MutT (NUDIX family)
MADYISWLRARTGPAPVLLNFAAACVCDDDGRVLLQRRGDGTGWGFPGGAMELGESAAETAVREVLEETGLHVRVTDLLGAYTRYRQTYPSGDVAQPITLFFRCAPAGGRLRADGQETAELRWVPLGQPPPALFTPQHQDAFADLAAGRTGVFR